MLNYLDLTTTDPAWNLAVEEYVFDHLPKDRMYVMLWQNDHAIIIGKHQNTLAEINESYVKEQGIRVVRRLSGGGAVYHDLGNLNFSFIADAENLSEINFKRFCLPVVKTLQKMGVPADVNGDGKITAADARKILRVSAGLDKFNIKEENKIIEEELPVTIELSVSSHIPSSYINDQRTRIEIYKIIALHGFCTYRAIFLLK